MKICKKSRFLHEKSRCGVTFISNIEASTCSEAVACSVVQKDRRVWEFLSSRVISYESSKIKSLRQAFVLKTLVWQNVTRNGERMREQRGNWQCEAEAQHPELSTDKKFIRVNSNQWHAKALHRDNCMQHRLTDQITILKPL
jgi:hypothetical protein